MNETLSRSVAAPRLRPARAADIGAIHGLIKHYAEAGNLLPRSAEELQQHLSDFAVIEIDGSVVACGALELFTDELGEIRSLVVAPGHGRRGYGRQLVEHLMIHARARGLGRLMALTYAPQFFHRLGFETVSKDTLPEKVWGICVTCYKFHRCDEIAVLRRL